MSHPPCRAGGPVAVHIRRRCLRASRRDRLSRLARGRDHGLPGRPPGQAPAGGGPRRGRQDRTRQGRRPGRGAATSSCYEGVDESRALYEWRNRAKQLLRVGAGRDETWDEARTDIFSEEFLLARPLLTAIRGDDPKVLLIDETDKADVEVEGLLLEVLSDFQVAVPGARHDHRHPHLVVLTSNASRELSEALRRRCLFLHIGFPEEELERRIVRLKVPGLDTALTESVVRVVGALREMDLRKVPSVAETIDWARTLLALGADTLDGTVVRDSLGVLLKHQDDILKASAKLDLDAV